MEGERVCGVPSSLARCLLFLQSCRRDCFFFFLQRFILSCLALFVPTREFSLFLPREKEHVRIFQRALGSQAEAGHLTHWRAWKNDNFRFRFSSIFR